MAMIVMPLVTGLIGVVILETSLVDFGALLELGAHWKLASVACMWASGFSWEPPLRANCKGVSRPLEKTTLEMKG
eukprot:6042980-Pyramimonas_sp.AAC.1